MSFLPVVPSQSLAVRYLDRMAAVFPQELCLGGHSKGGNLAVYAAASASPEIRKRICRVYNNDGPGFSRAFLDSPGFISIRDRVRTIVPQTSIVGMLLEHECAYTVVKSTQSGIFQHDGFSWEVLGTGFVPLADRTSESKIVDRTLKNWLSTVSAEEREKFVETLYDILSSTRAETLSDIRADKDALSKILKSITPEQRSVLQKTLRALIYEGQRVLRADRDEKRSERRSERREEKLRKKASQKEGTGRAQLGQGNGDLTERAEPSSDTPPEKRRGPLMVAVRPIRFHIVKTKTAVKQRNK